MLFVAMGHSIILEWGDRSHVCVGNGFRFSFMNKASDFSKPLQRGPVICPIPYDPGGTELDAF